MNARAQVPGAGLRRHDLVHLDSAGWQAVDRVAPDDDARARLAHWATHDLPLVVTRQSGSSGGASLQLGLPAPCRWKRRRLAVQAPRSAVSRVRALPALEDALALLPQDALPACRRLSAELRRLGVAPRLYGSHGWEVLTGLPCRRQGSDIDLLLPVTDAAVANAVTGALPEFLADGPRLDGELLFADGAAVGWREWRAWRQGRADRVLVKRLHTVALEDPAAWQRSPRA